MRFKRKNYLNGIDWTMNAIHLNSQKHTSSSNDFIIVMELQNIPDCKKLDLLLRTCIRKFPLLKGHPSRGINLAPYWKYNDSIVLEKNILSIVNIKNEHSISNNICEFSNEPMNTDFALFRLFMVDNKSFLAAKFDHRLFDGRGAEGFLSLVQREWLELDTFTESNNKKNPSQLKNWGDKFTSGKVFNRTMKLKMENCIPESLSKPVTKETLSYSHNLITYNKVESAKLLENANKHAGLFMTMPFILANFIMCFHAILKKRGQTSGNYIIPVTIDQRQNKEVLKQVFFNNWSMIFFRISQEELKSPIKIIESIKEQMFENMSNKFSFHMTNSSYLMRILPLRIMNKLMTWMLKGTTGSFSFSFLKESVYEFNNFMDTEILNLYHIPNMPVQPGIGLFFSSFDGKINAVLSYIESILSDQELAYIEKILKGLII